MYEFQKNTHEKKHEKSKTENFNALLFWLTSKTYRNSVFCLCAVNRHVQKHTHLQ